MPYLRNAKTHRMINKAAGDLAVLFQLGALPDLVKAQSLAAEQATSWVANSSETLHMTAVMTNGSDIAPLQQQMEWGFPAIALIVDSISSFEVEGGYAVYASCRWNSDLLWVQENIFSAMVNCYDQEQAVMVSAYSLPNFWVPHITLGKSSTPIYMQIDPFAVLINNILISDENFSEVETYIMKSVGEKLVQKAVQLEVISKSVHFTDDGDLVIPVIAIPFKGPVSVDVGGGVMKSVADLAGDFFHTGTDIGPASEVVVDWDHHREQTYMAKELKAIGLEDSEITALGDDFGFGDREIGIAQKALTTEEGIIFNVILNRRTKYLKAMGRAAQEGLIGASGEFKSFEYDPEVPGKVDYACMVGVALSPSPYNIEARPVLKATDMEEKPVPTVIAKEKAKKPAEGSAAEEAAETPAAEAAEAAAGEAADADDKKTSTKKKSLAETLQAKSAALKGDAKADDEEDVETTPVQTITMTKAMYDEMTTIIRSIPAIVEKSISDFTDELREALPMLGELIVQEITPTMTETVKKSKTEFAAEDIFDKKRKNSENAGRVSSSVVQHNKSASMQNWPGSKPQ